MTVRKFILDSDWWTDCDDAVAVRLLCNAHRRKEVELLGINLNACMEFSIPALDVFTRDAGVNVPLGLSHNSVDFFGKPPYQKNLAQSAVVQRENQDVPESIDFYRQILSQADDNSVEILSIGFTQELAKLLKTPEDMQLVTRKVTHLWIMAGKWDEVGGREYNFHKDDLTRQSGAFLCDHWPTPITFLGWEIGVSVLTGNQLQDGDLLKQVMIDHGSVNGRSSWDPMLVLLALIGDPEKAGYRTVCGKARVDAADGSNYFTESSSGIHRYVVKMHDDSFYADAINSKLSLSDNTKDI